MNRFLRVNEIVCSVSETHLFDANELYAVNTSDVYEGELKECPLIQVDELKGQFKKTIKKNDILFSEIRPANRHFAMVQEDDTAKYVASTKLMVLRKINDDVDLLYFYYWLTNKAFLNVLQARAENRICSFPQITFELLSEYKVPIPSIDIQKKISNFLKVIDDKIRNNKSINIELESMASTIYEYWFMQFDFPDVNGKPYKATGGIMQWNEELHCEIPCGWECVKISDIAKRVKVGFVGTVDKYYCSNQEGYPIVRPAEMSLDGIDYSNLRHVTEEFYETNKKSQVHKGDILISRCGKDGIPNIYELDEKGQVLNAVIIEPDSEYGSSEYIAEAIKSSYVQKQIMNGTSGSVQGVINTSMIGGLKIPYNNKYMSKFSKIVIPIYKMMLKNRKENKELIELKELLLPLLMDGTIGFMEE